MFVFWLLPFFLALISTASAQGVFPRRGLERRADCRTIQVRSGDGCASLARRCGITSQNYNRFNPARNHCSTLKVGQYVCCSSGTLPDRRPKPNSDGSCASYTVQSGDWCGMIADDRGLTTANLESFNTKTWGWNGCARLTAGMRMCLSTGTPPFPSPVRSAVCGPQVSGTRKPTSGNSDSWKQLNPCPLNACCNAWGQCGIDSDFCINTSPGPPGAARAGTNGCISNCGMSIRNNGVAPSQFIQVGYFEAWNNDRPCLHMDVTQMPSKYSHIHFSFADITENFEVSVASVQEQFDKFVAMTTPAKRIVAFGGWTASTSEETSWIFRQGVNAANRDRLSTTLANFVIENNLDGIDLDWEYPANDGVDGPNYLAFIRLLRSKLGSGKSISVAAPASYNYLRGFPINDIAKVVDYIVYMTYDLKGQWDFGSTTASSGCPHGSCLRSHVNVTETTTALSMITKTGISSTKIVVGISSYGRSFKMSSAGCSGPMCTFTGPASGARPGRCTGEAGYLANAEIKEILTSNPSARSTKDSVSDSDILVYNQTEWVAYLSDQSKLGRVDRWRRGNFMGVADWAADLNDF